MVANVMFTLQARRAAAAAAQVSAVQPMLRAPAGVAYQDSVSWATPTLVRCSLVAFVGGSIAGAACDSTAPVVPSPLPTRGTQAPMHVAGLDAVCLGASTIVR